METARGYFNDFKNSLKTRRNLRQETVRPQLFFKVLSKEIINSFHLPWLRTHNNKQIKSIKTPSNQRLYEQQTPLMKRWTQTSIPEIPTGDQNPKLLKEIILHYIE